MTNADGEKYELATLVEGDHLPQLKQRDQFLKLINQNPPTSWLKDHPTARGVKYMPIERIEWLLTEVFQQWHIEVLREGTIFNSITCTIRLHFTDPITGEWQWQDGVAAVPAKTTKGTKASDMTEILSDAVMTGLPAAKAYAIKDAAEHIGKLFGRDINRKSNLDFVGSYDRPVEDFVDRTEQIAKAKIQEELKAIFDSMSAQEKKDFQAALTKKKKELMAA